MARLYSDLLDGSGRRYYFGLNSSPGGITNASPAMLTLFGNAGAIQEQNTVFRNPATAMLTLLGNTPISDVRLQPAQAGLSMIGNTPSLLKSVTITNALPPDYTVLPDNAPTIVFIATISPTQATLTLSYPAPNVTQGGNIGFLSPGVATLSIIGYSANIPRFADVGLLTVNGLAPTIQTELVIFPEFERLICFGYAATLGTPFVWVDEDPPPPTTWIDDPRA